MIRHHLNDALLMGYAAGTLPEAFSLVAASHVSLCDDCRARLGAFEVLGGAVLDEGSVAMTAGAEACMMRSAEDIPAPARARAGALPGPLADYVGGGLQAVKWRPLGMGVRQAILPTSRSASARLLYIPAGVAVPDHGHRGVELTLVLQGAFRDTTDRFGPGDIEIAGEDLQHVPTAEAGSDCVCLAATDARLRFKDLLPRLLQPLFRI
ncbi:MAG: cupin domain-containing protein [Pseudorhodobacter sp.]|nr:cupin domain-containing protein [Pseudorhodobacter sp.]